VRPGRVSCTIGTSGVVFASKSEWRPTAEGSLHAFCHAVPGAWHVMGVMLSAAGSFRWYRDTIAREPYDSLTAEAATVAPGCDGLTFLPYLTGERCPHPDAHARGALVGIAAAHGRPHLTRAVLEGITMGLLDNVDLVRSLGIPVDRVRLAGGGARSGFWRQMCADLFNVPVATLNSEEGGVAYGAALLAGVGVGAWKSVPEASDACVRETTETRPGPDAARYAPAVARFRALYPRLAPIFRDASGARP
jgi:xylulokinase